jgi:hypothetical protein
MEISPDESRPATTGPGDTFTGQVTVKPLFNPNAVRNTGAAEVTFTASARTAWHTHRSSLLSSSEFCCVAARTVLAAAGGCSPVNRYASCAAGGPELPCLPTVVTVKLRPGRWSARHGPLSGAGSCQPLPERQFETTSADPSTRDGITVAASEVC